MSFLFSVWKTKLFRDGKGKGINLHNGVRQARAIQRERFISDRQCGHRFLTFQGVVPLYFCLWALSVFLLFFFPVFFAIYFWKSVNKTFFFLHEPNGQIESLCQILVLLQLIENGKIILKNNVWGFIGRYWIFNYVCSFSLFLHLHLLSSNAHLVNH